MKISMSSRDKNLLFILLIVVILIGSYFIYDKIATANEGYEKEKKELTDKYADLSIHNNNRAKYKSDTETNNLAYTDILNSYNTSLNQEQVFVFLSMVEKETGVWLKQLGLSSVSEVYQFGNVTSTNPMAPGKRVYSTDYMGISTQLNVSFECSYDGLKTVLLYLRENGRKVSIGNMSFSYSGATDVVSGTMQISMFAITGEDRPAADTEIKDVPVGTDNIFISDTFIPISGTSGDRILADYDLYLIMNRVGSDMNTIAVGQAGDPMNETALATDTDGVENVIINITGGNGQYKVSYKLGNEVYPADNYNEGATLVCGDSLDLLVVSQPREGKNDTSFANVTINNNSDIPVKVGIVNDDLEDSRVFIDKYGDVTIDRVNQQ